MSTLKLQKRTLRRTVSKTLAAINDTRLDEQSRAIMARVLAYPAVQKCRSISCYLNMPMGEVRTTMLVEKLIEEGKSVYVPKIIPTPGGHQPTTTMDFFRVYDKRDLHSINPAGLWGIREPGDTVLDGGPVRERVLYTPPIHSALSKVTDASTASPSPDLDVILLPGVAFDKTLSRLGHGKGYYDRFIADYVRSGRRKPTLIGMALAEQVLDLGGPIDPRGVVPMGEYDWKLDVLVWPGGIVQAEPAI